MWNRYLPVLAAFLLGVVALAQEDAANNEETADSPGSPVDDASGSVVPGDVADEEDADTSGSADPEDAEEPEEVDDAADGVLDEAFEDLELDEQTYEEDDDDFVPTEEIPADEPIPFPSNI